MKQIQMRRQRKKLDRFWIGLLVGIAMLCAMTVVFLLHNQWELNQFWIVMSEVLPKLPGAALQYAMICILPNSMLAFVFYRFELWDTHKGVMVVTLFSFAMIIFFLFVVF